MGAIMMGWAVLTGAVGGVGFTMMLLSLPAWRQRLAVRIAPYVSDVSPGAYAVLRRQHDQQWMSLLGTNALASWLRSLGPDSALLQRRMRQAGLPGGAARARLQLVTGALLGFGIGLLLALGVALPASSPLFARALIPVLSAALGAWAAAYWLQLRGRQRRSRIARELPTVLEFLSLSIAAGEALPDALGRVVRVGSGELVAELATVVRQASLGVPLAEALQKLATEIEVPALARMVAQLRSALERGNPLGEVLRAQAADQRVEFQREQLESAGRKEIGMMVPLVFLILPTTILFATWPGIVVLNSGF